PGPPPRLLLRRAADAALLVRAVAHAARPLPLLRGCRAKRGAPFGHPCGLDPGGLVRGGQPHQRAGRRAPRGLGLGLRSERRSHLPAARVRGGVPRVERVRAGPVQRLGYVRGRLLSRHRRDRPGAARGGGLDRAGLLRIVADPGGRGLAVRRPAAAGGVAERRCVRTMERLWRGRKISCCSPPLAALGLVALLVAAACGSGSTSTKTTTSSTNVSEAQRLVKQAEQAQTSWQPVGEKFDASKARGKSIWYVSLSLSIPFEQY